MPGPLASTGAISSQTRYGALNMAGEQFTGLWTQRSPYRDAASAYLVRKFYSGSRFDSMLDGINREITSRLTDGRRPGSTVYNANVFPAIGRFYSFKSTNNSGNEVIRLIADSAAAIYDATAGQQSVLFTKSAGAGKASFLSVGTSLYWGDGVDLKKWLYPGGWQAATTVPPGTLINVGAEPGIMQMALGGLTLPIVATQSTGSLVYVSVGQNSIPQQMQNLQNVLVTFSGLTAGAFLNGNTYAVTVVSSTLGLLAITLSHAVYGQTSDAGSGTTGTGITGGTAPTFSTTQFGLTTDGTQQWKCYGPAIENWGIPAPAAAPTVTPINGTRFWQPNTVQAQYYSLLDSNQNLEVMMKTIAGSGGIYATGRNYPIWAGYNPAQPQAQTIDGNAIWFNYGIPGKWSATTTFGAATEVQAILDSNQNLQIVTAGAGGASGATEPTWAIGIGATTTDGALTWTSVGPGVQLTTGNIQYAFSTVAIDGSVSTASPLSTIMGPILGPIQLDPFSTVSGPIFYIQIQGAFQQDTQLAAFWIWRTAQGQSTLILEDQMPIDAFYAGSSFTYYELAIPDTSIAGGGALNAFIAAPVGHQNDPPPAGMIAPTYHLQRIWAIVNGNVVYSQGPNAIVGNGNTAFAPLAFISPPARPVRLVSVTVQNGALLVFTTSGIQIVLGTGASGNGFYMTSYFQKVPLAGYDALDVIGTQIYFMESNGKVSTIQVEYPFNPQTGYIEVGFPIGDQFMNVTTGGILLGQLYNPARTFLSWNIANTKDTGMYVSDGQFGWFRMGVVNPPESGLVWNPRAVIFGGTSAVQSVETAPGVYTLLIGPAITGPILMRDVTGAVWGDNGTAYPSWDAKGVNLLCSTGQVTEVAHISTKSAAVGARPTISVLMGEIAPSQSRPWNVLEVTSPDPPDTPRSVSVYSDRYALAQNGVADTGDCLLTKFDYGTQAVADELLDWGIFASTEEERKEEAQNTGRG